MQRQPSLYIPHGAGPCFHMKGLVGPPGTWDGMEAFLRGLRTQFPEVPRALLLVTSHWETDVVTVSTKAHPGLFHDWFDEGRRLPPELKELDWPAPGAPDVAAEVVNALEGAGLEVDEDDARGFDHGVFVPMMLAYPDAEIPTVALSIRRDLDPAQHLAIGRALAPLRDRGVAIIGSGSSVHNAKVMGTEAGTEASDRFNTWLADTCALDSAARSQRLMRWEDAPGGRTSHAREEHLVPLFVVAGAAADDPGRVIYDEPLRIGVRMTAHAFSPSVS
jgi:aromatic ring-opening dioxygenase catalytic subunit (LigB family)